VGQPGPRDPIEGDVALVLQPMEHLSHARRRDAELLGQAGVDHPIAFDGDVIDRLEIFLSRRAEHGWAPWCRTEARRLAAAEHLILLRRVYPAPSVTNLRSVPSVRKGRESSILAGRAGDFARPLGRWRRNGRPPPWHRPVFRPVPGGRAG